MTFNKISRLPVIGDLAGVYFVYNTDTPIINGIYVKSTNESAAIKMADVTETLNGSNYLMVYGTGTPAENADELQAAYDAAKKMPRYLGIIGFGTTPIDMYAGQTFTIFTGSYVHYKVLISGTYNPYSLTNCVSVTPEQAKSNRTTIIVAPGEYDFGASAFVADASGINIVSLTGNSDVIISSAEGSLNYGYYYGIKVTANNVLLKGINCKTNDFYIANDLNNLICEYCTGGRSSFGADGVTVSGTFNNCTGGGGSFGAGGGTLTGTFNCCIGGEGSFGSDGGTLTGILTNCKLTAGTFPTPTGAGKIYNCIDGNGNLINTPLPIFADNAAAASLPTGALYRTATGVQMIKY